MIGFRAANLSYEILQHPGSKHLSFGAYTPGDRCFAFPLIVLVHAIFFIAFWLTNASFYSYTNDYLTDLLGVQLDFVSLCLLWSCSIAVWTGVRLCLHRSGRRHSLSRLTGWLYAIAALIYVVFFYASFWLLLRESPVQLYRLGQLLVYFRLILDPLLMLCATLVGALSLRRHTANRKPAGAGSYVTTIAPVLAPLALIWSIMLAYVPASVYQGTLPAKPLIIAHRGASVLAPENTLAALEKSAELGTFGVEFDLCLSRDGVPFLMHDDELKRTTNVAQLFPGRVKDRAESFTLAEVKQLNAGEWFLKRNGSKTLTGKALPAADIELYRQQGVPTLVESLDVVSRNKLSFIFDRKEPPGDHPYGKQFFDIVLKEIQQASIDSQVWFLVDRAELAVLQAKAPEMKPAYGMDFLRPPEAVDLITQGYKLVNAEYGLSNDRIRQYHASGLWVNIYTVDEAWQYSRLWLLGVDSVTSSDVQEMIALNAPILSLPYSLYVLFWVAVGMLVLVILGMSLR